MVGFRVQGLHGWYVKKKSASGIEARSIRNQMLDHMRNRTENETEAGFEQGLVKG